MEKNRQIFDRLARFYLTYYEIEWSSPANELALMNFVDWDDGSSESTSAILKRKGFGEILDYIKQKVPEEKIKLNSTVKKVEYGGNGAILHFENGEEHQCEHVIVTCPLGFLKRNSKSFFNPPLSRDKTQAIQSLGFGNMMKILVAWVSGRGPASISKLEDEELADGVTQHLREALGDQTIPKPLRLFR
ncbi:hypothetical protein OESDEN_17643 [Oesophagostomum dentatum]|uniref:Amine oxidase domain-containing protein n=1 Tax=Oesophagostomum dentatum TaxID=61180 RepID=A0A0B1SBL6_OESDE|nr:hypothetical protein OESDEN_17643 [Oesophagostomum dentatum]